MFLYSHWLKLPIVTRHHIARVFSIPKTGATEVSDNQVVKDGYKIEDIEGRLTVDALQIFLDTDETNMKYLWEDMVAKVEGRAPTAREPVSVQDPIEPQSSSAPVTVIVEEVEIIDPLPTLEEQKNQKTRRIRKPHGKKA